MLESKIPENFLPALRAVGSWKVGKWFIVAFGRLAPYRAFTYLKDVLVLGAFEDSDFRLFFARATAFTFFGSVGVLFPGSGLNMLNFWALLTRNKVVSSVLYWGRTSAFLPPPRSKFWGGGEILTDFPEIP